MNVVILSNYLNHHLLYLCKAFVTHTNDNFTFIATRGITKERLALGYVEENEKHDFVLCAYKSQENYDKAMRLCEECDVLIYGNAAPVYVKNRLKKNKLTFRYAERVYKKPCPWYEIPLRAVKYYFSFGRYDNYYLLGASAYTAPDYAKTETFKNKAYKWGYFPTIIRYDDVDSLISNKRLNALLWVGRFIDWKHPEAPIEVAKRLRADGIDFELNMIGTGDMVDEIADMIKQNRLEDNVHLLGSMSPENVRRHMEEASVYLFTSDRGEGWGAVLNESMNSACAVVSSHAIGSTPFLVNDGENGLIYKDGDVDDLYAKVKWLISHDEERTAISKNAYNTMINEWNPENAAKKLICLSERILNGEKSPDVFESGVCSKAKALSDDWYAKEGQKQ